MRISRGCILLLGILTISGRSMAVAPAAEILSSAAQCPDQGTSLPAELLVDAGVESVELQYVVRGGAYPTMVWTIDEVNCQPGCLMNELTWGTDELSVRVVNEDGAVLFSDVQVPEVTLYTPEGCGDEPEIPDGVTLEFSATIDVSALTVTSPELLTLTVSGCNTHPNQAGNAFIRAEIAVPGLPSCERSADTNPVITAKKTSKTTAAISVDYQFPPNVTGRSLVVKTAAWSDAKGRRFEEEVVREWDEEDSAIAGNGPFDVNFDTPSASRQVQLVVEARYRDNPAGCIGYQNGFGAIDCDSCNSSVGDPVSVVDGNMRYVDVDPLPPILEHALTRTFDSGHGKDGFFGIGWTTMFDQTINIVGFSAGPELIHLTTPENETAAFFGDGTQIWPPNVSVPATLRYDGNSGGYVYRAAGSRFETIFDPTDGFFVGLRDVVTGRELQVARHLGLGGSTLTGMTVADSWTGTAWEMTVEDDLVTSIAAPSGITWTYDYDANAYLTAVDGPDGPWRTYTYGTGGLTEARDAVGNLLETHQYDASGRAITSLGPSDEIANIEYDLPGPSGTTKTRITTGGGAVIETVLYPVGGAHRVIERNGGCSSCGSRDEVVVHDKKGRVVRRQDGSGYVTTNVYTDKYLSETNTFRRPASCNPASDPNHCRLGSEALATVTLSNTPSSVTSSYSYDDAHWADKATSITTTSVRQSGGTRTETRTYDEATGQVLTSSVTGWTGSSTAAEQTHTTTTALYDGSEAAAFDPEGSFAWASLPQPILTKSVDGPRTDVSDLTAYVYYPNDESVPAAARGRIAAVRNALGQITRFEDYDLFGNARRVVDPNGVATETTTDAIGRVLTSKVTAVSGCNTTLDPLCNQDLTASRIYDDLGPLTTETRPAGGVSAFTYDARGRLHTTSRGPNANDLRERIEASYDPDTGKKSLDRYLARESGNWVEKKRESYSYDDEGRLETITHADNASVAYTYDTAGRVATVRDENHAAPNTTYTYDPAGRLSEVAQTLSTASGGSISTAYEYDAHGNLVRVTDPNGNETEYLFDDFGRMLLQESPVTGVTTYSYDAAGHLIGTTDANAATTTRTYDALGRVLSAASARQSETETVSWEYDDGTFGVGRLGSMTDPTGSTEYTYDRRGLLLRESRTIDGSEYDTAFRYDEDGNRSRVVNPGGRIIDYTFDYAGRPSSAVSGATTIVTSTSYLPFGPSKQMVLGNGTTRTMTFDNRYRPSTNVLSGPGGTIASYTYGHDSAGNITAIHDALDAGYDRDYAYDDLNRLIGADGGASLWGNGAFAYDAMGNMTSSTLGAGTKTFSYSTTTPKLVSVLEDGTPRAVTYDAAGNELAAGALASTYSPRNLLQSGGPVSYSFDGRGVRTVAMASTEILSLTLALESTQGGVDVAGEIVLSEPAPPGGVVVHLASDSVAASVPESIEIPATESSAEFVVGVSPVDTSTIATITASLGWSSESDTLLIQPNAALASLSFAANELAPGASTTGTVALDAPAPAGGALIGLSADHPSLLTVPASITIPAAETEETFTATSQGPVASVTPVVVTAAYDDGEEQAGLELLPPQVIGVSLTPSEVEGGQDVEAEVTLSGPAAAGTNVTFESTNESAEAPEPVTIAAGSSTGQATIRTELVAAEQTAVITALLEPTSATASLTIEPLAVTLGSLSVPPSSVVGSNATVLTVTLTAAAPQQGVAVELVGGSGSPLEHVPFVTVPAGQSQVTVPVGTALEPDATSATIHARHGLTERNAELAIQSPPGKYVSAFTLASTRAVGGDLVTATLELSEPASFGTQVTLASSAPIVAMVPTKVNFPINTTTKTFIVDTDAVTEPVDVTITGTYNGVVRRVRLTVVPASQTLTLDGVTIDSEVTGGNDATGTVTLSGPAPAGGASVVLSGSRRGVASVPASVTVPQGATSANFVVETMSTNYPRGVLLTASYNHLVRTDVLVVNGGEQLRSVQTLAGSRDPKVRSAPRAVEAQRPAFRSKATRTTFRSPTTTSEEPKRRFYLYTPELNLLAETELTTDATPGIEYEYVWFGGQPVAQIATTTNAIAWYFNDHLGTPVLQTDASAEVVWRIEREPFGKMFEVRAGAELHQPLVFPGQEEDGGETSYNIFRWYRSGWGRYTQVDPILGNVLTGATLYGYANGNPTGLIDPLGLSGSKPSGPYHPPDGVRTKCERADTCRMIEGKMWVLNRMIESHTGWDRAMGKPRGGSRHATEITQLWIQYAYCQRLYEEKCKGKCEKRPWWKPSPETLRDVAGTANRIIDAIDALVPEPPIIPVAAPGGVTIPVPVLVP